MEFRVDMATLEKLNNYIVENVDPKFKNIVSADGIDNLKKEVAKNPELKKFFNVKDCKEEK